MQTTTTIPASRTCPDFGWCITDHTDSAGLHVQAAGTMTDLYGMPVTVELFHDARTGRTGVAVGGHEISLTAALQVADHMQRAVAVGLDLPGALTADLVAGGAR